MSYYRGLIIVEPHGTYIKEGTKTIIIKSLNLSNISNKPLLLIEAKRALGIIYVSDPEPITIKEFRGKRSKHQITKEERIRWWSGKKILYEYRILKSRMYRQPIRINYKTGPQVLVKPENIWKVIDKPYYIGTSGYTINKEDYFKKFSSIEINTTYYGVPATKVWRDWYNESPRDFKFSIKLNRNLLYYQSGQKYNERFNTFIQRLSELRSKLGAILVQYNKHYKLNTMNLKQLSDLIKKIKATGIRANLAFEFRHNSWFNDDVNKLLKKNRCAMVISHIKNKGKWTNLISGYNPLLNDYQKTTNFVYIRMHGTKGKYTGSYDQKILRKLANFLEPLNINRSYIYFNNTNSGDAIINSQRLVSMMDK